MRNNRRFLQANALKLSDDTLKFQLPCSDYPQSCGYVSPGIVMTFNIMDSVDYYGDDRYSPSDVTVSVACKPKIIYPSDSTNWTNDQHEVPRSPENIYFCKRLAVTI